MTDIFIKTDQYDDVYIIVNTLKAQEALGFVKLKTSLNDKESIIKLYKELSKKFTVKSEI